MEKRNAFELREAGFESRYFEKKNAELVDRLKEVFQKRIDRQSIREATGVTDEQLLDRLVEWNLSGEFMAAFRLLPLAEIAWADGPADAREKLAVLEAAEGQGIAAGTKAHAMLERRLNEGPSKDLRKIWYHYAAAVKKSLTPEELEDFRSNLLDLCRRVAEASGGILGMVLKTSANEKKVLEAVEKALS